MTRAMTVAQLSRYIKGVFDDEELLHDVTLSGEVAEVSYSDKHTYIVLADGNHSVRCVRFFSRDSVQKGARVALHGSVRFYDRRNAVTFAYDELFVCGDGEKNAKLAEIKERLKKLGYFENRPQLPEYILNVIAVTSPDGAAIRDFLRVVGDKSPFVRIRVYPARVQGDGAGGELARAVTAAGKLDPDVIVLCRGGGSDEDLDCFNDEKLATAVAISRVPIISAVGHEVDYTLCDFCAGTRAGTPSIAGEIVNAHATALLTDMQALIERAGYAANRKFDAVRQSVTRFGMRVERAASAMTAGYEIDIKALMRRASYAIERKIDNGHKRVRAAAVELRNSCGMLAEKKSARLYKLSAVLGALDPKRIIDNGYAAAFASDGKRISSVTGISAGDGLRLVFADGVADAVVSSVKTNN